MNAFFTVGLPFLASFALSLPNVIIQIVTLCRKKPPAPFMSFITSLLLNMCYGFLSVSWIPNDSYNMVVVVVVLASVWLILFACCGWCCYSKCGQCFVICHLCNIHDIKNLQGIIKQNRALPPDPVVSVEASHKESREIGWNNHWYNKKIYRQESVYDGRGNYICSREVYDHTERVDDWRIDGESSWRRVDQGGGRLGSRNYDRIETEYRTVKTWSKSEHVPYGSWQEEGTPVNDVPYGTVLAAEFSHHMQYSHSLETQVDGHKNRLYQEGRLHDTDVTTSFYTTVPGWVSSLEGIFGEENEDVSRIRARCGNKGGYLLWFVCLILGYQSSFECFTSLNIVSKTINCVKRLTGEGDRSLRAASRENDMAAAEAAIPRELQQRTTLFSNEEQRPKQHQHASGQYPQYPQGPLQSLPPGDPAQIYPPYQQPSSSPKFSSDSSKSELLSHSSSSSSFPSRSSPSPSSSSSSYSTAPTTPRAATPALAVASSSTTDAEPIIKTAFCSDTSTSADVSVGVGTLDLASASPTSERFELLSDTEFRAVFGLSRADFLKQPQWKQEHQRREKDLW